MSRAVVKSLMHLLRIALSTFLRQLQSMGLDIDKVLHSRDFEEFVWEMLQARAACAMGLNKIGMKPTCDMVSAWLATMTDEEKLQLLKEIVEKYVEQIQK